MKKTTIVLWVVYICLLAVLLPHTAWAFSQMEPGGSWLVPWVAAIAFEAAIAALTYKLTERIENPGKRKGWKLFTYRYVNPFSMGLMLTMFVSALANLAHAVQFAQQMTIFAQWGISERVYSLAFGGILPLVSLTFASVLSNVTDTEEAPNPELEAAKGTIRELTKRVKDTETQAKGIIQQTEAQRIAAEDRAKLAEDRLNATADVIRWMFADDKRERILNVKQKWPALSGQAIAVLTETSPAYVSETLKQAEPIDVTAELAQREQAK